MKTWLLIADAAHARVVALKPGGHVEPVPGLTMEEPVPPTRELQSDRAPRTFDSVGYGRHAIERSTAPRRVWKREFARQVAEMIETAAATHAFDRIAIAAPPSMLGDLRAALPKSVADKIVAELPRDLVKTPDSELLAHFPDLPSI